MDSNKLRNGPSYPPEAEATHDGGKSEEDRQFIPLKRPVTVSGLERDDIPKTC
jgi:hypothetical protein